MRMVHSEVLGLSSLTVGHTNKDPSLSGFHLNCGARRFEVLEAAPVAVLRHAAETVHIHH